MPSGRRTGPDAGADRTQANRWPAGCAAGRLRTVPLGRRPSMDRYDRGPAGRAGRGGATVTARLPAASARAGSVLEARDVVKSFGSTPALRGASVSVARGEILAVMGPSGSGKSTLLHCLAGILVPESGEIRFQGRRIDTLRENQRSALRRGSATVLDEAPRHSP